MIENLFLCVGAQKSGTTWLYSQLENHPDVGFSDVKEVHYFNTIHNDSVLLTRRKVDHIARLIKNNRGALERYFIKLSQGKVVDEGINRLLSAVDDAWYVNLFSKNVKKYSADFSPEYALLPKNGFEHIKRVSKHQKIIFMMRDPIARARSAIQYFFQTQNIPPESITHEMVWDVARKDFIVGLSRYDKTIFSLKDSFVDQDLKFIFFEDVMNSKQKSIEDVYNFLDVKHVPLVEEKSEEKVNSSQAINFPAGVDDFLAKELGFVYSYVKSAIGYTPVSWKL